MTTVHNGELSREIIERVDDAIVTVNKDKKIVFVNHAAEKLFGWTRHEMLGRDVKFLVPPNRQAAHEASADAYIAQEQPEEVQARPGLTGLTKDGEEIAIDIKITPLDGVFVATIRPWQPKTPKLEVAGIGKVSVSFLLTACALVVGVVAMATAKDPVHSFWLVNMLLIATGLGLVTAYGNAIWDALRNYRRGLTAGHLLTFGIIFNWIGLVARQTGWYLTGQPPQDYIFIWTVSLGLSLIGGVCHIAALDAVEARWPPRYFITAGFFVTVITAAVLLLELPI